MHGRRAIGPRLLPLGGKQPLAAMDFRQVGRIGILGSGFGGEPLEASSGSAAIR